VTISATFFLSSPIFSTFLATSYSKSGDVDFAAETANFQKWNLLAQSGSYALSQANAVQQNVMRLLQ